MHQQCTALGGKFVWVFDVPFTHYIHQGKLSKRGKEYRKVQEYRAKCVHPIWLNACQQFGQRVPEKLYASTYNPNRSLTFVSVDDDNDDDDDDEEEGENRHPPTTTKVTKHQSTVKRLQPLRSLPIINKTKKADIIVPSQPLSSKVLPPTPPKKLSQISNEAETMLNDLESSLAQFLNNNTNSSLSISRSMTNDDEQNRKSLHIIRSINHHNNENIDKDIEPSMRVEWLDDAMQAERKKIKDEDEHGSQQQIRSTDSHIGQKRPLIDSNFDQYFNSKKCRI